MSEAIRKALEAAAKAYCHNDGECPCAKPGDCHLWQSFYPDLAIAIGAFFEAVPIKSPKCEEKDFAFPSGATRASWAKSVRDACKRDRVP